MHIPTGFAHVTHLFTGTAAPTGAAITYGVQNSGDATAGDIAVAAHLALATVWEPFWPTTLTLDRTLVKKGPNSTGESAEHIEPRAGDNDVAGAPPNCAYLISKRTSLGGRHGRGRIFMPGVDEGNVDPNGFLEPGELTQKQGLADSWFEEPGMFGFFPMVLLHTGSTPAPTIVSALSVQQQIATQRQRLRR